MREVLIYKRLQAHRRLIKMMSYSWSADEMDGYVIFEYMRVGSLDAYLASGAVIAQSQQLDWCLQATEGIAFLHSSGVIHGDIKPENMVLDDNMCVRIIDFSGSSIDGLLPLCLETARYFLPRPEPTCSVQTDLFALGSSIYHIMQRAPPYKELDTDEIENRYARQDFPEVTNVFCGSITAACWRQEIESASAIYALLQAHQQRSIFAWLSGRFQGVLRSLYQGWAGIWRRFRSGVLCGLGRLV
ncbi:hypothetical protein LLEC1_02382 [Akanthomyces lecanii]|uniref:Protein kinase domain-containing protein n=1 Tax=Cordyceps confragosa TaxID=2714763 RepID=A0A179IE41_CORDF|nr:hypothetical protein LLEC1_02382 [Akanthomyces lecanii]